MPASICASATLLCLEHKLSPIVDLQERRTALNCGWLLMNYPALVTNSFAELLFVTFIVFERHLGDSYLQDINTV